MKKLIVSFFLLFLCSGAIFAQQLSYRFANPKIVKLASGFDHLQFDIQIKCDLATTYLWTNQIKLSFNNATFDIVPANWKATKGSLLIGSNGGVNSFGNFKYSVGLTTVTGVSPNKTFNIPILPDNAAVNVPIPSDADFNLVPVDWVTLVTVSARLLVTTGDALAGIDFFEPGMNGFQQYITGPSILPKYLNPNLYDSRDFLTS
ncbi:MAG TPA: hypothetical protein VGK38_13700, partial [Prolixibacteraceae bacterium]